jgi:hypothetical protein
MSDAKHPGTGNNENSVLDGELNLRLVGWMTLGLLAIIAIAVVAMWFLGIGVEKRLMAGDPPPPALPEARVEHQPPAPNLQVDPRQQLLDLRAEEERILTTYGWIDRAQGLTRVPIDRAMDLLVEQGLPTPPSTPAGSEEASTGS